MIDGLHAGCEHLQFIKKLCNCIISQLEIKTFLYLYDVEKRFTQNCYVMKFNVQWHTIHCVRLATCSSYFCNFRVWMIILMTDLNLKSKCLILNATRYNLFEQNKFIQLILNSILHLNRLRLYVIKTILRKSTHSKIKLALMIWCN